MTSKDELREKVEAAIKDGLSNHTGEWFNSWIVPGLNLTEEQLRDLLFYLTKAKRLQDNILNLLEGEKQKAYKKGQLDPACQSCKKSLKLAAHYHKECWQKDVNELATLNKEPNKGEDV